MRIPAITAAVVLAVSVTVGVGACRAVPEPVPTEPALHLPDSVAAMGDSISQAAQADGTPGNQPDSSWSTGQGADVNSLAMRISELSGTSVTVTNLAVSGAVSADMTDQASQAVAVGAEFVTVLVGGNDVCNASSVATLPTAAEYADNVRAALNVLAEGLPESSVLLGSIPSIAGIHDAGSSDAAATQAWRDYGVCRVALADPNSTEAADVDRRAAVEARVTEMNTALASVASEYDSVLFDQGRAQDVDFLLSDLSAFDYFHPSVTGQNLLAETEWGVLADARLFAVSR